MNFQIKIIFSLLFASLIFAGCGNDDDICTSGEATPRLKMKFKTAATGKLRTLDTLYVAVDYGEGPKDVIMNNFKTDSVLIPLRVDEQQFTNFFIRTSSKGPASQVRIGYITENQYVSPACGIKRLYKDISATVQVPNPVVNAEKNQNEITDEIKTHLFLHF